MFSKELNVWGQLPMAHVLEKQFRPSKLQTLVEKSCAAFSISGKSFASLSSELGMQEFYRMQGILGLLPELIEKPKKSNEEAKKLRVKGNQVYAANDLTEALRLYTRAICCAEWAGEEMAMAYANRSAVTFTLKEYQHSIVDANQALSTGYYPKHLTRKLLERRGKCFIALQQYKKAAEDFSHIISLILPTELDTAKVSMIKTYIDLLEGCVGKEDVPITPSVVPPKLTHDPSAHIQSASAAVDIAFSLEMGRHIVATVDIAPGDVLAIEKPFASALFHDEWEFFCHLCLRKCFSSIPCASCNEVVFCSELCRETSWTDFHSLECQTLHNLNNLGCRPSNMLAFQTLLKATKLGENLSMFAKESESDGSGKPEKRGFVNNVYMSDHFKAIHHLITHKEQQNELDRIYIAVNALYLVHVLKETTIFFEHTDSDAVPRVVGDLQWNHILAADLLMRYIMVSSSNAFLSEGCQWKLEGDELVFDPQVIGYSLHSFLSLLNHSCNPNTAGSPYNGNTFVAFAIKPIAKGQQVFVNYGPRYESSEQATRQQFLLSKFYFACKCTACLEDWPTFPDIPENPTFVSARAKKSFDREVRHQIGDLSKIFINFVQGKATKRDFQTVTRIFPLLLKYVKGPWKLSFMCQQVIRYHLVLSLNPYKRRY